MSRARVLVASDLHGSNACFIKLLNLAVEVSANAVAIPGDLTGKEAFIGTSRGGRFEYRDSLGAWKNISLETFYSLKKQWSDRGIYTRLLEGNINLTDQSYWEIFSECKIRRLRQWLDYATEKIGRAGVETFLIPGNDDTEEITPVLEQSIPGVKSVDGIVCKWGPFPIFGLGYSNETPYLTARELTEEEIGEHLSGLGAEVKAQGLSMRDAIALIHVPPVGTGLDIAPEVFTHEDGSFEIVPGAQKAVGSQAVREFILEAQPLCVFSGHCHDGQGVLYLGHTFCVNPGSAYQLGTLKAVLVVIEDGRVLSYQALMR